MARRLCTSPLVGWALLLGVLLTGCAHSPEPLDGREPAAVKPSVTRTPPAVEAFRSTRSFPAVASPVRLRIPGAGVHTGLQRLHLVADKTIQVPSRPSVAGWYADGPRPGQPGPAVLVGHVDSANGPAVFYRLAELRPGDRVYVDRADGSTARFRVVRLTQVPKTRFPTDLVYAPTLETSLRLVTCGGGIDPATGHYTDNVIVFAVPD